jgi:hypothetical protein
MCPYLHAVSPAAPWPRLPISSDSPETQLCYVRTACTQCRDFVRHVHASWCLAWRCAGYRDCVGAELMGEWGGHFDLGIKEGEGT